MIKELDPVVLTCDIPSHSLKEGDIGTVVLEHRGEGFEVEFVALDGDTLAVVALAAEQVRAVWEMPHARAVG